MCRGLVSGRDHSGRISRLTVNVPGKSAMLKVPPTYAMSCSGRSHIVRTARFAQLAKAFGATPLILLISVLLSSMMVPAIAAADDAQTSHLRGAASIGRQIEQVRSTASLARL